MLISSISIFLRAFITKLEVLPGMEVSDEIYKSILSNSLFILFKNKRDEKETYEGGRFIDAEIRAGEENLR
jgi:hypothetical protein